MKGEFICKHDCVYAISPTKRIKFKKGDIIKYESDDTYSVPQKYGSIISISKEHLEEDFEQYYTEEELAYWRSFEHQTAKDILCALMVKQTAVTLADGSKVSTFSQCAEYAIDVTEIFVNRLKKKENQL